MTFCLGIKVQQGLVALVDTQIVRGSERLSKIKITLIKHGTRPLFIMTSGLRSVRDKTVIYLEEQLNAQGYHGRRRYCVIPHQIKALRSETYESDACRLRVAL